MREYRQGTAEGRNGFSLDWPISIVNGTLRSKCTLFWAIHVVTPLNEHLGLYWINYYVRSTFPGCNIEYKLSTPDHPCSCSTGEFWKQRTSATQTVPILRFIMKRQQLWISDDYLPTSIRDPVQSWCIKQTYDHQATHYGVESAMEG